MSSNITENGAITLADFIVSLKSEYIQLELFPDCIDIDNIEFMFYVSLNMVFFFDSDREVPSYASDVLGSITKKLLLSEYEIEDDEYFRENEYYHSVTFDGVLSSSDFKVMLERTGIRPQWSRNGGILTEIGIIPAISFEDSDDSEVKFNAYVTPLCTERRRLNWDIVRKHFIEKYE